jgi:competence protein ComEA
MNQNFISRTFRISAALVASAFFAVSFWQSPIAGQEKQLPDGPGKQEAQKLCSGCHELEKSFSQKQDRVGWQRTVDKMVAFGMKGTDKELATVLDYLAKHFPADDVPKINVNKAAAIDLESGLSLKRSQAAAIVAYRTKNGDFKSIEDLKKVPGIEAAKIEAKKDRLEF